MQHRYVHKLGARAAYAKFIRRRDPRAALISRRNLNAYHVPPRRGASRRGRRDYHNRAIIAREFRGLRPPLVGRRAGAGYLSQIRPCLTINSRWRISPSYIQVSQMTKRR